MFRSHVDPEMSLILGTELTEGAGEEPRVGLVHGVVVCPDVVLPLRPEGADRAPVEDGVRVVFVVDVPRHDRPIGSRETAFEALVHVRTQQLHQLPAFPLLCNLERELAPLNNI
jgi:hypothetical protein